MDLVPEGNPVESAPVGTRYFRRQFNITDPAQIKNAMLTVAADDLSIVYINGKEAGRSLRWQTPVAIDASTYLHAGVNTLAIQGTNGGDAPSPAGLIADLHIGLCSERAARHCDRRDLEDHQTPQSTAGKTANSMTAVGPQLSPRGHTVWRHGGNIAGVR